MIRASFWRWNILFQELVYTNCFKSYFDSLHLIMHSLITYTFSVSLYSLYLLQFCNRFLIYRSVTTRPFPRTQARFFPLVLSALVILVLRDSKSRNSIEHWSHAHNNWQRPNFETPRSRLKLWVKNSSSIKENWR